jgi:hypothetical protein
MDGWMGTLSDTYEEEYFTSREAMDRSDIIGKTDQITCPTLLMHGMYDDACPVSHSQIVFRELRARGVPTEMVRENGFVLSTFCVNIIVLPRQARDPNIGKTSKRAVLSPVSDRCCIRGSFTGGAALPTSLMGTSVCLRGLLAGCSTPVPPRQSFERNFEMNAIPAVEPPDSECYLFIHSICTTVVGHSSSDLIV